MRIGTCGIGAMAQPHPLPIHIMDSDIYAYAPAVLLGTVDKLALIGQSARTLIRVLGMFGFAGVASLGTPDGLSRRGPGTSSKKGAEASGCEGSFRSTGTEKSSSSIRTPLLEIQDEAHLLDESLGTFSGLFETTFLHALRTLSPLLGTKSSRKAV